MPSLFYSSALHKAQPASTYAFSELRKNTKTRRYFGESRVVNILWRGVSASVTQRDVEKQYGKVVYKGVFTDGNFLVDASGRTLKVVGPLISIIDFEDGPIKRPENPDPLSAYKNVVRIGFKSGARFLGR